MKRPTILGSTALLCLTLLPAASAAEYFYCGSYRAKWNLPDVTYRLDSQSFPASGSVWETAVRQVLQAWNDTPSRINFLLPAQPWVSGGFEGNNKNEVFLTELGTDNQPLAYCALVINSACAIREADVVFNMSHPFTASTQKSQQQSYAWGVVDYNFREVALHELGHALGLAHEVDTYSVMNPVAGTWHVQTNGSTVRAHVGEDSVAGALSLYGADSGGRQDLAVVHWRRTGVLEDNGSGTTYAEYARTRLYAGSVELPKAWSFVEPFYLVSPGQQVRLELTYENNGQSTQACTVHYFLSTNDYVSYWGDTYLASTSMTLAVNTVSTTLKTLTLPTWLVPGTIYYLGAWIDPGDTVDEVDENNNGTYLAILVQ